eukprot:gene20055-19959_t
MTGAVLALGLMAGAAGAQDLETGGKLLLTGGVSSLEGSGGGGLATWATTTGYGAEDGVGGNLHATLVSLPDFELRTHGLAVGLFDRVELSYARQEFDTGSTGGKLGLGDGFTFGQDVVGLKVVVLGDAVYDQDRWYPQVAVGAQYRRNDQGAVVAAVGGVNHQFDVFGVESVVVAKREVFGVLGRGDGGRVMQVAQVGFVPVP